MMVLVEVGEVRRISLPGYIDRRGKILAIDPHGEEVRVEWVDYPKLPREWIPIEWA